MHLQDAGNFRNSIQSCCVSKRNSADWDGPKAIKVAFVFCLTDSCSKSRKTATRMGVVRCDARLIAIICINILIITTETNLAMEYMFQALANDH